MTTEEVDRLGPGGRDLWDSVTGAYELHAGHEALLLEACRCKDRLDLLAPRAAELEPRAMREERLTALSMARLLGALKLPSQSSGRRGSPRGF